MKSFIQFLESKNFIESSNFILDGLIKKVKEEYECYDFSSDDICVIHIRYFGEDPNMQLDRNYWVKAIYNMLAINPNMTFLVISNDKDKVVKYIPELENNIFSFDMAKDYSIIKNAKFLILGNSSFAYFPAFTNEVSRLTIAPKYWARHNISDGYWSCGYNIHKDFIYMDREGKLQTYHECLREFELYKQKTKIYG
jgi:hypothetical protein